MGKYGEKLKEAGVEVTCLDMPNGRITFKGVFRLFRVFRAEKPDVVQTWMYHADLVGGLIARLSGVKSIFWNIRHSELLPGKTKRTTILVARACAFLSRWVPKTIICCAEKARSVHSEYGYARHEMVVIPNGYDLERFYPDKSKRDHLRDSLEIEESTVVFGMVGRFNVQKNHLGLLKCLSGLKEEGVDFCCLLVGKGMDNSNVQIREWLETLGLSEEVVLLGQQEDVPSLMNALDVHLLSSSFGEGFPNVIAEAMACGKPCITTDVGDAKLIVGNTGWVVPVDNEKAFVLSMLSAVEEIRGDPERWAERSVAASNRIVEEFSLGEMVKKYHSVWKS